MGYGCGDDFRVAMGYLGETKTAEGPLPPGCFHSLSVHHNKESILAFQAVCWDVAILASLRGISNMAPDSSPSDTNTASLPAWATPEEWAEQKDKIIDLYWVKNRPLAEVVDVMTREHSFYATYVPFMHPGRVVNSTVNQSWKCAC
jgi:hypothetical protein